MKIKDLELPALMIAASIGSLFGQQPKRNIRAQYRKKRDKRNKIASASRRRNR